VNRKHNPRVTIALCALALAATWAPGAQAAQVCNEARANHPGAYDATDGDPNPPARFQDDLEPIGDSAGLVNAAAHSPVLSVCAKPRGGGDGGGGGGGGIK